MNPPPTPSASSKHIPPAARLGDALAVAILLALAVCSVTGFDQSWDALAYHLPYSALRTGILTPRDFVLEPGLQSRYDGFPAFIDILQGGLWRLFGTPKAAALITPLAIAAFAVYGRIGFGLGMIWSILIFLAVPILHAALAAAYVDIWTNAFFAIHLMAAFTSLQPQAKRRGVHAAVSLLALAIAVNSKEQYYILGGLSFGLYMLLLALAMRIERLPPLRLAWTILLVPAIFAAPLHDLIVHGNPIYPMAFAMLGWQGPEHAYFPAGTSEHMPQILRYFLSQMDLDALDHRAKGYSIDQGEAEYMPGYHMGGSSGILLSVAVAALALCLRRIRLTSIQAAAAIAMGVLVLAVANFPGSNELRYFSFVEIVLIFTVLCLLRHLAATNLYALGLQSGVRAAVLGSALFVGFLTGFAHVQPHPTSFRHLIDKRRTIDPDLARARALSDTICYARPGPDAILYADIFHGDLPPYRLVESLNAAGCPSGAAVIR